MARRVIAVMAMVQVMVRLVTACIPEPGAWV